MKKILEIRGETPIDFEKQKGNRKSGKALTHRPQTWADLPNKLLLRRIEEPEYLPPYPRIYQEVLPKAA